MAICGRPRYLIPADSNPKIVGNCDFPIRIQRAHDELCSGLHKKSGLVGVVAPVDGETFRRALGGSLGM